MERKATPKQRYAIRMLIRGIDNSFNKEQIEYDLKGMSFWTAMKLIKKLKGV
jgi:hypothetical protein